MRRKAIDFGAIRDAWLALSDAQIVAYGTSIPAEWAAADEAVRRALALIRDARDNIDGCLAEVERILR